MGAQLPVVSLKGQRYPFAFEWYEDGKRHREYFRKRGAADDAAGRRLDILRTTPAAAEPLSRPEWAGVILSRREGIDLEAAVKAAVSAREQLEVKTPFEDLAALRVEAAIREKRSARYVAELAGELRRIGEFLGDQAVQDITVSGAAGIIFRGGARMSAATVRKRRVILVGVLALAVKMEIVERNVAALVQPPSKSVSAVEILTPEESRGYILALAEVAPQMLPAESIGLYAGLRRAEIERLDWRRIHLARGYIEVTAGTSKTKSRRLVEILPPLAAILEPFRVYDGPVVPINARRLMDREQKRAGWSGNRHSSGGKPWPKNVLRHSFASYHLAHFGDIASTEMQAGHDRAVLFEHYRELVDAGAAAEFWSTHLEF